MKRYIFWMPLLFSCLVGFGQKDPEAEAILKKVADKAKSYKTIQADFEYTIADQQKNTEEIYDGSVLLKGSMFKMSIDASITYCDGKTRWVYLKDNNEVNISNVVQSKDLEPEERFLNNPMSLFTLYQDGFKYVKTESETINNQMYSIIDLTPEDIKKPYFKIRCWVSESNDLFMMRYFQKDATHITFKFKKFIPNIKVIDADFIFDTKKYPDIEVIDLRE